MNATALWSFALIVGLLTVTPGLDTALVLRTAAVGHTRRAWGTVLGIQTGTLAWAVLTSLGVTALLTASPLAYDMLRLAGAAYLCWLGVRILLASRRGRANTAPATDQASDQPAGTAHGGDTWAAGWRQGTLTNILNPKVGAFYVAVLPQFIPPDAGQLGAGVLLAGVHIAFGVVWSALLIGGARLFRRGLSRPAVRRRVDRLTGTVIAAFGVQLALSDGSL